MGEKTDCANVSRASNEYCYKLYQTKSEVSQIVLKHDVKIIELERVKPSFTKLPAIGVSQKIKSKKQKKFLKKLKIKNLIFEKMSKF